MVINLNSGRGSISNSSSYFGQKGNFLSIKFWRMKKTEDTLERDDNTWYWCPHHKMEGAYDGLYVTHKAGEHDKWKKNKAQFCKKKFESSNNNNDIKDDKEVKSEKKLTINDNLKAVLLTHCMENPSRSIWPSSLL